MKNRYIRIIVAVIVCCCLFIFFCGCDIVRSEFDYRGYDMNDNNYHFDKAIIKMPDDSIVEVYIDKWSDSEDGEQITITSKDGKRYLVNSVNCVLIEDDEVG